MAKLSSLTVISQERMVVKMLLTALSKNLKDAHTAQTCPQRPNGAHKCTVRNSSQDPNSCHTGPSLLHPHTRTSQPPNPTCLQNHFLSDTVHGRPEITQAHYYVLTTLPAFTCIPKCLSSPWWQASTLQLKTLWLVPTCIPGSTTLLKYSPLDRCAALLVYRVHALPFLYQHPLLTGAHSSLTKTRALSPSANDGKISPSILHVQGYIWPCQWLTRCS